MNSSVTLKINPRHLAPTAGAPWAVQFVDWLGTVIKRGFAPQDVQASGDESVRHLLALADAYEATQPSYAADLRAAAQSHVDPRGDLGRRAD